MRLVVFVTFIACVSVGSSTLLGSNKCTWGPSYWCSHVSRARECGAVDHCLQTVWTKQQVTVEDGNTECELCEKMINMTRNLLKKEPVNVSQLMKYIRYLCTDLGFNPTYKAECLNIVTDMDMVVKLFQSNMTAKSICGVFMTCSGFDDKMNHHETNAIAQLPLEKATPINAGNICTDCVVFLTDIKNLLTDPATEKQLIGMVKQIVCAQLQAVEAICDDLVETYVPQGLSLLASYVDPQVTCSMAGFCGGKNTQELQTKFTLVKNFVMVVLRKMGVHVTTTAVECDVCKEMANEIRTLARDPVVQKKIVDFIEQDICVNLGKLADLCKRAVDDNAAAIFQLIAGSLINDQVCVDLGLCTSQVLAAVKMGTVECGACKVVIETLAYLEASPSIQNTLKGFIENDVCTKLGASEAECKKDVELYAATVFQLLKQVLNANYLCGRMSLCAAVSVPKVKTNGAVCDLCREAVKEIDVVLNDKSTQAEVEMFLDNICQHLQGNLAEECKAFVEEYTPFVLSMLAQELNPDICKTIGLCSAKQWIKTSPPKTVGKTIGTSGTCAMCEMVVRELANLLKKNGTKDEVRQELDEFCGTLPTSIMNDCEAVLDLFFDEVYALLINNANPKLVCTTIELCSTKVTHKPALPQIPKKFHVVPLMNGRQPIKTFNFNTPKSSEECLFCEKVLMYVEETLKDKKPVTEDAIKHVLDVACEMIPRAYQHICEQYTPQLVLLLQEEDDPNVICPKLGLCGTAQQKTKGQKPIQKDTNLYFKKHMFAKNKCDLQRYWCISKITAKKCGKEDYCKNLAKRLPALSP